MTDLQQNLQTLLDDEVEQAWTLIEDENSESTPELVKAVHQKKNRHLIELDAYGSNFFGIDLKPKPLNPDCHEPDAHVELQVKYAEIVITYLNGDYLERITYTERDPAAWENLIMEASSNPAGFVLDELYRNKFGAKGNYARSE